MSNYHRFYEKGGIYFFTVVTHDRKPILCNKKIISRLREAFQYTQRKYPFKLDALVVLPDHLHCIWKMPPNDDDFSKRWNILKRYVSLISHEESNNRREKNFWQRRFWEHLIRDEDDYNRCIDYIFYNPVKHGYVDNPLDWQWRTIKQRISKEIYTVGWDDQPSSTIKSYNYFHE